MCLQACLRSVMYGACGAAHNVNGDVDERGFRRRCRHCQPQAPSTTGTAKPAALRPACVARPTQAAYQGLRLAPPGPVRLGACSAPSAPSPP